MDDHDDVVVRGDVVAHDDVVDRDHGRDLLLHDRVVVVVAFS